MKFKNRIILGLTAATIMAAPLESAARVYNGTLDALVESLKPLGVEITDPSFKLDPSTVFMQLYTDGAITADGRLIDKDKSNVAAALAKGGLNPGQINFAMKHFSDLALINTGMNSALITGDLKKQFAERGLDQRILYAGHPDSLIAAGIMPLTTAQANAVYGLFFAGVNREASSLGEFEKTAEVSVPVIANSGVFQGQAYSLLSLLAFRPFDAGGLRHQMIDELGVYNYVMNSWEEARRQGHIVTGNGKVRVRLERSGQGSNMRFSVISRDGRVFYQANPYVVPLERAWQQAGGRPRDGYANLAELVNEYIVAKAGEGYVETVVAPRDTSEQLAQLPLAAPPQVSLPVGKPVQPVRRDSTAHAHHATVVDLGVGVGAGQQNNGLPQIGISIWAHPRVALTTSLGYGQNMKDESIWQTTQGTSPRLETNYTSKGSPALLEVLAGVETRHKGLHVGVQVGLLNTQGDYDVVGDERLYDGKGVLKSTGRTQTTAFQKKRYTDVRLQVGYQPQRFGAYGFVGRHKLPYGGAGVRFGF